MLAVLKPPSSVFLALCLVVSALAIAGCNAVGAPAPTSAGKAAATGGQEAQTQKVSVEGGGSYTNVNPADLGAMLRNKDFVLVNVHIPYEGEIERTDLFIPYNEIESNVAKLPADKGARLVVYCRSGSMSAIAAPALVKLGYTNVGNLDGGMNAWKAAGYPLLDKK